MSAGAVLRVAWRGADRDNALLVGLLTGLLASKSSGWVVCMWAAMSFLWLVLALANAALEVAAERTTVPVPADESTPPAGTGTN